MSKSGYKEFIEKERRKKEDKKKKRRMKNVTCYIPEIYDENLQKLIRMNVIPSRSEGMRIAIREYLHKEYDELKLLGFFNGDILNGKKKKENRNGKK